MTLRIGEGVAGLAAAGAVWAWFRWRDWRRSMKDARRGMEGEGDPFGGDPGRCPDCGAAFAWVRPGKSQACCGCWATCRVHGPGAIRYHEAGDPYPNMSGYYCLECWRDFDRANGGHG